WRKLKGTVSQPFDPGKRAAELRGRLDAAAPQLLERSTKLKATAKEVWDAAHEVGKSWSGSAFGWHGELYYRDFERPPLNERFSAEWGQIRGMAPGWRSRSPEEVKERIQAAANAEVDAIPGTEKELRTDARGIVDEIIIQLAPLDGMSGYKREVELVGGLEEFDWKENESGKYFVNALKSFPTMSRDSSAIQAGRVLPAHTYWMGIARQAEALAEAVELAISEASRALRQVELKGSCALQAGNISNKKIFLVHGHDEGAKHKVARFLESIELDVTILSEQPNKGKTIIEKFESNADAGFAVVLLTGDDRGRSVKDSTESPRARQNVVLELGYFFGRLGRDRTCVLYAGDAELPNDIAGLRLIALG